MIAGELFGLHVGEALLEVRRGRIVTGDGLEGVLELAAVSRHLVVVEASRG